MTDVCICGSRPRRKRFVSRGLSLTRHRSLFLHLLTIGCVAPGAAARERYCQRQNERSKSRRSVDECQAKIKAARICATEMGRRRDKSEEMAILANSGTPNGDQRGGQKGR